MKRIPAYIAHQLNAPTAELRKDNREVASSWCAFLSRRYLIAPVADWIVLSSQWDETTANRELGLEIDRVLVELCGIVILVGTRVSDGMRFESEWARVVVDLTSLSPGLFEQLAEMDRRVAAAGIERAA